MDTIAGADIAIGVDASHLKNLERDVQNSIRTLKSQLEGQGGKSVRAFEQALKALNASKGQIGGAAYQAGLERLLSEMKEGQGVAGSYANALKLLDNQLKNGGVSSQQYANSLKTTSSEMKRTGNVMGSLGNKSTQIAYAIEDFTTVLSGGGGLTRALSSVTNNLTFMAASIPHPTAQMAAMAAIISTPLLVKMAELSGAFSEVSDEMDLATGSTENLISHLERLGLLRKLELDVESDAGQAKVDKIVDDLNAKGQEIEIVDTKRSGLSNEVRKIVDETNRLIEGALELTPSEELNTAEINNYRKTLAKLQDEINEFDFTLENDSDFEKLESDINDARRAIRDLSQEARQSRGIEIESPTSTALQGTKVPLQNFREQSEELNKQEQELREEIVVIQSGLANSLEQAIRNGVEAAAQTAPNVIQDFFTGIFTDAQGEADRIRKENQKVQDQQLTNGLRTTAKDAKKLFSDLFPEQARIDGINRRFDSVAASLTTDTARQQLEVQRQRALAGASEVGSTISGSFSAQEFAQRLTDDLTKKDRAVQAAETQVELQGELVQIMRDTNQKIDQLKFGVGP